MGSQFSSRPNAQPDAGSGPERVEVTCESWDQFEQVFRRRLESHQVFVPSINPPPPGTQLEFRFSIPDGTSISMAAHVLSSVPPPLHASSVPVPSLRPTPSGRPGMFVEFGGLAHAEERRVHVLLHALELEHEQAVEPLDCAEAAFAEAMQQIELYENEEAIRLLVRVLNADPDNASARLWMNIAGARHAKLEGEPAIAVECYRAVLALQPDHAEAKRELSLLAPVRPAAVPLARVSLVERLVRKKD